MNVISPFARKENLLKFTLCFYMVLMSVQIIALEGMSISTIKAVCMTFSFFILFTLIARTERNATVLVLALTYWTTLAVCSLLSSAVVSWDRLIYRAMFLSTFICHYYIIYSHEIKIDFARKLFASIICAYGVVFILQYLCFAVGIRELAIINLSGATTMDGSIKANCLAIEPSHAARIMAFIYWGYIKLTDIKTGKEMSIIEHFQENRYTNLLFWITMLGMGSSTAMLGAAIVGIHFFKKNLEMYALAVIAIILFLNIDFHIESIDRLKKVINAFLSDDVVSTLKKTESSGGSRIAPIVNTFTQLDLFSKEAWLGKGSDYVRTHSAMWTTQRIGDINDFGLISYIVSLIFVFKCCIRKFFCIDTLLFAVLLGFSIGSLYTCWCGMMVCTIIRFFDKTPVTQTERYS